MYKRQVGISTFNPWAFRETSGPRRLGARGALAGTAFGPPLGEVRGLSAQNFVRRRHFSRGGTVGAICAMPGSQESLLKYYEVYVYAYQKKKKRPNCEIEICLNTYMYEIHLSGALASCFTPAVGLFSPFRLRGMQVGCVYTGRKFGAWPGSVARALGVQSRASWFCFTGSLAAEPEPSRTMETSQFS